MEGIPAIDVLCELAAKAGNVSIVGKCPRIRAYIEAEVRRLKMGAEETGEEGAD